MWKLELNGFVFWLALLCVVSTLAFANTSLKHTPFKLECEICEWLISQYYVFIISVFIIS